MAATYPDTCESSPSWCEAEAVGRWGTCAHRKQTNKKKKKENKKKKVVKPRAT